MLVPRNLRHYLANLNALCRSSKHQPRHKRIIARIVPLSALLIQRKLRVPLLTVRLEGQVVAVLLVICAVVEEVLQVGLTPLAVTSQSLHAQTLRIVDSSSKFCCETVRKFLIRGRQHLEELVVHEADVHHHIVSDDGLADLSYLLDDSAEAQLIAKHAVSLTINILGIIIGLFLLSFDYLLVVAFFLILPLSHLSSNILLRYLNDIC